MLAIEPGAGSAPLARLIAQARQTLDINMYLFTDRPLIAAVRAAVARGVHVRILLDRRPYGGRPRGEVQTLRATGAEVHFAPARFTGRYRFDHAKYLVTGNHVAIGTANFTWSAFHRNREYDWLARQPAVAQALRTVFRADWTDHPAGVAPRRTLVLSPGATPALLAAIRQPGPICIESEEMGNDRPILAALRQKGRLARIVLPTTLSRYDRRFARALTAAGVHVRFLASPYIHAKLIAGPREAFIGSENFSWTSLNRNREVGVMLGEPDAQRLFERCEGDWARAQPGGS